MADLVNETVSGSGPTDCFSRMPPPDWRKTPPFVPGDVVGSGTIDRGDCNSCAWLMDVLMSDPGPPCMLMKLRGGSGRCGCIGTDASGDQSGIVMVYDAGLGGWLGIKGQNGNGTDTGKPMVETCCGCGSTLFKITSPDAMTASLTFGGVHVACVEGSGTGSVFTLNLTQVCCGVSGNGHPYVLFAGKGLDPCGPTPSLCDNTFTVRVECGVACPAPACDCEQCLPCCNGAAPLAWYAFGLTGFASDVWNGGWIWGHDEECQWSANCKGNSSILHYIHKSGVDDVWRLEHGPSTYEIDAASWQCCGNNTFLKVSGSGPGTITVKPAGGCKECSDKVWPDTLYAEVTAITLTGGGTNPFPAGKIALTKVPATPWSPPAGWQSAYYPNVWDGGLTQQQQLPHPLAEQSFREVSHFL